MTDFTRSAVSAGMPNTTTDPITAPATDVMPPITAIESISHDWSAGNSEGLRFRLAASHSTPAPDAMNPDIANTDSLTTVGETTKAAAAGWLSRTATNSRPGLERRRADAASAASASTARAA